MRQSRPCPDPTPSDRRRLPAVAALLLGAVLVVTACGSNASSASPSSAATPSPATSAAPTALPSPSVAPSPSAASALDAIYDAVEQQVIGIRGLQPTKPVARQFIDPAEAKAMLTKEFDKDTPAAYLAAQRAAVQGARAHPGRSSLRDLTLDLLERRRSPASIATTRASSTSSPRAASPVRPSASTSPTSTTTRSRTRTSRSSRTRTTCSTRATGSSPARRSTRATRPC